MTYSARNHKNVTIYGRHSEIEWSFPSRWAICGACNGHGTTTRHIECDGGGFTASEWAEACGDDPQFADDYFSGRYDRPCPDCDGLGRVTEIDEERVTSWRDRIALKAYHQQERDEAEYQEICAMERRMGA